MEIYDYLGNDIAGDLTIDGQTTSLFGGPGGLSLIDEVPSDQTGGLGNLSINALATYDNATYGISTGGLLVRIDTNNGTVVQVLGNLRDEENPSMTFSNFQAADFDSDGNLYAVVRTATFNSVLVSVEIAGAHAGDLDPVGKDVNGLDSYQNSRIGAVNSNITTMVRDPYFTPNPSLGSVVQFIGFDTGASEFVTISTNYTLTGAMLVSSSTRATADDNTRVDGLMYDNQGRLFGLLTDVQDGAPSGGSLVLVNLDAAVADRFTDVEEYGTVPGTEDTNIVLMGMSFNSQTGLGYATDPNTHTLYTIAADRLIQSGDEFLIEGGVADVYFMYVVSSTADVYITMTYFTEDDSGIHYNPTGGEHTYLFTDEDNAEIFTPDNAGGVMIGTSGSGWIPTTYFNSGETGDSPAKGFWGDRSTRPGIVVGQPDNLQDIGLIQVGGGIFGDVVVNGSIGTLYAGYLATNTIAIKGEIQNLAVNTHAGGIPESDNSWMPVDDVYMQVEGVMRDFYSQGDWGIPIEVRGRVDAPSFPGVLDVMVSDTSKGPGGEVYIQGVREIERKYDSGVPASWFPWGTLDTVGGYIITNDSPYIAQYLGAVDGKIRLLGEVEWMETSDYYSFSLMAGQTVTIELFDTWTTSNSYTGHPYNPASQDSWGFGATLFDSELNEVAALGEADLGTPDIGGSGVGAAGTDLPLVFTAETAGIYTVEINFFDIPSWSYRLDISGTTAVVLGGGNVGGDLRSRGMEDDGKSNIWIPNGNMGALSVGGAVRGGSVRVDQGSLGALRAAANVKPAGDSFSAAPAVNSTFGFYFDLLLSGDGMIGTNPTLMVGGDVGLVSSYQESILDVNIGGNLQALHMGAEGASGVDYIGHIVVGGNIGEIVVQGDYGDTIVDEFGVLWSSDGGIFANADGLGPRGVIDVLRISGDFGQANGVVSELPLSVGARGGNVRFVDIGGNIIIATAHWVTGAFGPFTFNPGQAVEIVDDSGALVQIAPGYRGGNTDVFNASMAGMIQPTPTEGDGGVLTLKILPVRDQTYLEYVNNGYSVDQTALGFAIVEIQSTDGLRVSSKGGPVEIGLVTVAGVVDDRIIFDGSSVISALEVHADGPAAEGEGEGGGDEQDEEDEEEVVAVGIRRVINNTRGGDIVSLVIGSDAAERNVAVTADTIVITVHEGINEPFVDLIRIDGNLGYTAGSTGQLIRSKVISALIEVGNSLTVAGDPGGLQRSGLLVGSSVTSIQVTGALGDVDVRGDVNRMVINSDNSNTTGQFDGVAGAIIIHGNLGRIELGDGITDPGTGRFAQSGLFVYGSIDQVNISGYGNDIAGPILAADSIDQVNVSGGSRILGYNAVSANRERARNGFGTQPTIAVTNDFEAFWIFNTGWGHTGDINSITVKGEDSYIFGAHITAAAIHQITVNGGAEGIFSSVIGGHGYSAVGLGTIDSIVVGGEGIRDTIISANRQIGQITVAKGGTIEYSEIRMDTNFAGAGKRIGSITADAFYYTDIDAGNKLDKVTARDEVFDLAIEAGELGTLQVKNEMLGSAIFVAGPVKLIQVGDDLISTISITGPFGNLKSLKVGGDLGTPAGGEVLVDGQVGKIAVGGDFLADFYLNYYPQPVTPGNPQGGFVAYPGREGIELKSMVVGGQIRGIGHIGGDVKLISSGDEFGVPGSLLHVYGDLKTFAVGSKKSMADLESSLIVDGDLGKMTVYGNVNGQIDVVQDFRSLTLIGGKTADARADLNASITVGGDFDKLTIVNGDISETDVVDGGLLTIDVNGEGPKITIKGSDIDGLLRDGGAGQQPTGIDIDGSLNGTYIATGDVERIVLGENLSETGIVIIDGNLGELVVEGSIEGKVYVSGNIGSIAAGHMGLAVDTIATITAGGSIGTIAISGQMQDSYILAGFDPGMDWDLVNDPNFVPGDLTTELTVDGTTADPAEQALAGDIQKIQVGLLNHSVIAAGVHPGRNTAFGDLDGSDTAGSGLSRIGSVVLGQVQGDGSSFGIFADTEIGSLKIGKKKISVPAYLAQSGFGAWTVLAEEPDGIDGIPVQQGMPLTLLFGDKLVTITMSGPGLGLVVPGTDQIEAIQLSGTTDKTKVKIEAKGSDAIDVGRLFTSDDGSLKQLVLDGRIGNADSNATMDIGGGISNLSLGGIGAGTAVNIGGSVGKAEIGILSGSAAAATEITVQGDIGKLRTGDFGAYVSMQADNMAQWAVRGDMDGSLTIRKDLLGKMQVSGDMAGTISSEGTISRLVVGGVFGGGVRAKRDIDRFVAGSMFDGVVAAKGDFDLAQITGNMEYSTLAAGLDTGPDARLDVADGMGRGDLKKVVIGGDFVQSNLAAGIASGADGYFATGDDFLASANVEQLDAPKVNGITISSDLKSIDVSFLVPSQGQSSSIGRVQIKGYVEGSPYPSEQFAIVAAGEVGTVFVHGKAFGGSEAENIVVENVTTKGMRASTLTMADIRSSNAAAAPFRVVAAGMDSQFGTADDILIHGDDDDATDPTVWLEFDETTQTVKFGKNDGFLLNNGGTNYYQIVLDASQITNIMGVPLDGEFSGQWPTGDGLPGNGNFVYYFSVGDWGDSIATAFTPFPLQTYAEGFPTNLQWQYCGQTGDGAGLLQGIFDDLDTIQLTQLQKGQILNIGIDDAQTLGTDSQNFFQLALYRIEEANLDLSGQEMIDYNARNDLAPARDVVIPELDELAYAGGRFYAYENIGQQFYSLTPLYLEMELLENDLEDLNNLLATPGTLTDINALGSHGGNSIWAIADFQPLSGTARKSLVLITDLDHPQTTTITLSAQNLGSRDIVGLAELDGVLYGLDAANNALVALNSDLTSASFGQVTNTYSLTNTELVWAGLSVSRDGDTLLALHDQPLDVLTNFYQDALYEIHPDSVLGGSQINPVLYYEFPFDMERHGLAVQPGGVILAGLPLRGSPVGDTIRIDFASESVLVTETQYHVFGDDTTVFSGLNNRIVSDKLQVLENNRLQNFIAEGMYYAFEISYDQQVGPVTITITDMDWLNDTDFGQIASMVTDSPNNVNITGLGDGVIRLEIDTDLGDGSFKLYFAGTSWVERIDAEGEILMGGLTGERLREDLSPVRDLILPNMTELATASANLYTFTTIAFTDELRDALPEDLVEEVEENGVIKGSALWFQLLNQLPPDMWDDLDAAMVDTSYDALGYDADQEYFALVSTNSQQVRPILVKDPLDPEGEEVPLTLEVLSDIFDQTFDTRDVTIDAVRGFEFGVYDTALNIDELWMVATVTIEEVGTYDFLLNINSILNPYEGMMLGRHRLTALVNQTEVFMDITDLAYRDDKIYAIDSASDTLVTIDSRMQVIDLLTNEPINNPVFGKISLIDGQLGNLGDPGTGQIEIVGLDFDSDGVLYALDNYSDSIVRLNTETVSEPNAARMEVIDVLAGGDYSAFHIHPNGVFYMIRAALGSPVGQTMQITVNSTSTAAHTFGTSATTTVGGVSVSSSAAANEAAAVVEAGGFYRLDIAYGTAQGDLVIDLNNILWVGAGSGDVDSVFVSDPANVTVVDFDGDFIRLQIDSNNGSGTVSVYFGATSDLLRANQNGILTEVASIYTDGQGNDLVAMIPDDGNYIVEISSLFNTTYDLDITLYDDGNGDFGIYTTTSGIAYDPIGPSNRPISLAAGSPDLVVDEDDDTVFYYNPARSGASAEDGFRVEGELLVPGEANSLAVHSQLGPYMDVDVYSFQLEEGQRITVDIDSDINYGRDTMRISVGIYNGDLESVTTAMTDEYYDVVPAQAADPIYTGQAVFTVPNHGSVTIDPSVNGVGTYYVVVSGLGIQGNAPKEESTYTLKITTTEPETVQAAPSQLVWLAFDGAIADFLAHAGMGYSQADTYRPAFDIADFGLGNTSRSWLIQQIADRIEVMYRQAGLGEDEIEFTLTKPGAGQVYSTVVFGGTLDSGLNGLAESVDRNNSDRTDMAVILTEEMSRNYWLELSDDLTVRREQVINMLANTGAHELGHTLGLEHAREVSVTEPNNLMNYFWDDETYLKLSEQEFEERTSFLEFAERHYDLFYGQIGFQNEIDILLRNIGSGTPMGK